MDNFQVALNSIEAFLMRVRVAAEGVSSESTCKPTHVALSKLVRAPTHELYRVFEEVRLQMDNIFASVDLPREPELLLEIVYHHIDALTYDLISPSHDTISSQSLVQKDKDTIVGVSWGLLSALPVLTFSPGMQRWFAWSDLEHVTIASPADVNRECFRIVDIAELTAAISVDAETLLPTDRRTFLSIDFVAMEKGPEKIVHELVIAVGGGFFAVLARDTSVVTDGPTYLFRAVSRTCKTGTCYKVRDILAQVQAGGYLTFVSYLALRTFQKDLPEFSSVVMRENGQGNAIIVAAKTYVLAASRLWPTERILQTLRREIHHDAKQERFVQELTTLRPSERVFSGSVHPGYATTASIELSKHITELDHKALKESALNVLLAVHALRLDAKLKRASIEHNERMMWSTFLHQLHMEGNVAAAMQLAGHMSDSM